MSSTTTDAAIVDAIGADGPGSPDAPTTCTTAPTCANGVLMCSGEVIENCLLGCFDTTRCNKVGASNGLDAVLDDAATKGDVTLPSGTTINTDDGTVIGGTGAITVDTKLVSQTGGPQLRVFYARTFTVSDIRVTGTLPMALVASGDITITGIIDASADTTAPGPGGNSSCGAAAVGGTQGDGHWSRPVAGDNGAGAYIWNSGGTGGGGFGSTGAAGGSYVTTLTHAGGVGGAVDGTAELVPLRGGCPGGGNNIGGAPTGLSGAGGGAIQIVSGKTLLVNGNVTPAGVNTGGGGGSCSSAGGALNDTAQYPALGGGSGGGVLFEGAIVGFQGTYALILAAGGGGGSSGGCGATGSGQDATATGAVATGGACPAESWGTPTTGGAGAATAPAVAGSDTTYLSGGGGGGGLGRIRINTASGAYTGTPGVRGNVTKGTVKGR